MDASGISQWPDTSFLGGKIPAPGSWHVSAFTASLGSVTNNDTAALADGIILVQNNHLLPQVDADIVFAYASGATLGRARLNSPKIRQINPAYIRPINVALSPANNPNLMLLRPGQLRVRGLEELAAEITTTGAGPAQSYVVIGMRGAYVPVPQGDVFNFRATSATAVVANTWTSVPLTFETLPPVGTYAVVGCEVQSATGVCYRLTFDGQYYRPGLPCITALGNRALWDTYYGTLGVFGFFRTTNLPRLEVVCTSADAAQEVYLECVRVG